MADSFDSPKTDPVKPMPVPPKMDPVKTVPVVQKVDEPEPVAPAHLRLESGTMHELMMHVKTWLEWDNKRA